MTWLGALAACLLLACGATSIPAGSGGDGGAGPGPADGGPGPGGGRRDGGADGGGDWRLALTDLGDARYLGFPGGLYPAGRNELPDGHAAAGLERASHVRPLDGDGNPSPTGKYALLSIGMSNTTQEFCSQGPDLPCDSWTFVGQATADPSVNRVGLVLVNGARGGQAAPSWVSPASAEYDRIRDTKLAPLGLTERQVQVAWVKVANARPAVSLPSAQADAYVLLAQLGSIARALRTRYPNLQQVFVSSRIYGGYATTPLNPEPYAFESGLAVKWLIEAQIVQMQTGTRDPRAGDLRYDAPAPWIAWGPYLWAGGTTRRSDGLVWERADLEADGTHPSRSGETKVGRMLLDFFRGSAVTRCWFVTGATCP